MFRFWLIATVLLFANSDVKACPFCDPMILDRQLVYEGDHLVVLLDHTPRVEGHLLIVPKEHLLAVHELSFDAWIELRALIRHSAAVFAECLHTQAYTLLEKNHCPQFQEVPHIHFHLFPVGNKRWEEIFNIDPVRLKPEELQQKVNLFRERFNSVVYAS